jgi:uncharacterized protein (DUF1810 family)
MNAFEKLMDPKTPTALKKPTLTDPSSLKTPRNVKAVKKVWATPTDKHKAKQPKKQQSQKSPKEQKKGPPKAKSAYLFFCAKMRSTITEKLKTEKPDFKQTDVMKQCGVEWKALGDADKKPYADSATADKERYQKELTEFKVKEKAEKETKQEAKKTNGFAFFLKKMKTAKQDQQQASSPNKEPAASEAESIAKAEVKPPKAVQKKVQSDATESNEDLDPFDLESRFCSKHKETFSLALLEIKAGHKESCWSWFIFPVAPFVVNGNERGSSQNKRFCLRDPPPNQLKGLAAAKAYLRFKPTSKRSAGVDLRANYLTIMTAVAEKLEAGVSVATLVGSLDEPKLKSSLELFEKASADGYDEMVNTACKRALKLLPTKKEKQESKGKKTGIFQKSSAAASKETASAEKKRVRFELGAKAAEKAAKEAAKEQPGVQESVEVKELVMEEAEEKKEEGAEQEEKKEEAEEVVMEEAEEVVMEEAEEMSEKEVVTEEAHLEVTEMTKDESVTESSVTESAPAAAAAAVPAPTSYAEWLQRGESVNGISEHFGESWRDQLSGLSSMGEEQLQMGLTSLEAALAETEEGTSTKKAYQFFVEYARYCLAQQQEQPEQQAEQHVEEPRTEQAGGLEEAKEEAKEKAPEEGAKEGEEALEGVDDAWLTRGNATSRLAEIFPDWRGQLVAIGSMDVDNLRAGADALRAEARRARTDADGGDAAAYEFLSEYAGEVLRSKGGGADEVMEEVPEEAEEEQQEKEKEEEEETMVTEMEEPNELTKVESAAGSVDLAQWRAKGEGVAGLVDAFPDWEDQLPAISVMPAVEIDRALEGMKMQMAQLEEEAEAEGKAMDAHAAWAFVVDFTACCLKAAETAACSREKRSKKQEEQGSRSKKQEEQGSRSKARKQEREEYSDEEEEQETRMTDFFSKKPSKAKGKGKKASGGHKRAIADSSDEDEDEDGDFDDEEEEDEDEVSKQPQKKKRKSSSIDDVDEEDEEADKEADTGDGALIDMEVRVGFCERDFVALLCCSHARRSIYLQPRRPPLVLPPASPTSLTPSNATPTTDHLYHRGITHPSHHPFLTPSPVFNATTLSPVFNATTYNCTTTHNCTIGRCSSYSRRLGCRTK